jgi:hypothetical protein
MIDRCWQRVSDPDSCLRNASVSEDFLAMPSLSQQRKQNVRSSTSSSGCVQISRGICAPSGRVVKMTQTLTPGQVQILQQVDAAAEAEHRAGPISTLGKPAGADTFISPEVVVPMQNNPTMFQVTNAKYAEHCRSWELFSKRFSTASRHSPLSLASRRRLSCRCWDLRHP